ncbi:MAG: hypothetical protein ACR2FK_00960 [Sphingomicrobium sp.]
MILGAAALLGGCAANRRPRVASATAPRVLFVCQFGSVKSAVAREIFRRRATERRLGVSVQSRGITPEEHASPALAAALRSEGLDRHADPLRALQPGDLVAADVIILFDPLPSGLNSARARDWSDLPSMNADYPAARADLVGRIDRLIDELAAL